MIKNLILTFLTLMLYEALKRFPKWDKINEFFIFIWYFLFCSKYRDIKLMHFFMLRVEKHKNRLPVNA